MNEYITERSVKRGFDEIRDIYETIRNGRGYIAGSYAAYMAVFEDDHIIQPNDVDIFAVSERAAESISHDILNMGRYLLESVNETVYLLTPGNRGDLPIQIIKPNPKWQSFPDDILEDFDMDICRAVLVAPNKVLADENIGEKTGKFLRINNPLRSLKRALKYHKRGIEFNEWELLKLFQSWDQLPDEKKQQMLDQYKPVERIMCDDSGSHYDNWHDDDDWFEGE